MNSSKRITFVWCLVMLSVVFALPITKNEAESGASKPESIVLIEMPADEKPTDPKPSELKPNEMAVDPKPIEAKPTEQTKPNEPLPASAPTTTILETIPMNSARPQLLYDQRQDGKYNIRADLENFVILVVPSTGNSLLDLLKRSGQRQPQQHNKQHNTKQHHKKYHSVSGAAKQQTDPKKATNRLDYLNRPNEGDASSIVGVGNGVVVGGGGEFIEGRTPYHVDISSEEILQPAAYGVRSFNGDAVTIADLPLANLGDNMASTSSSDASDSTIILSTVTGKPFQPPNMATMSSSNTDTSPRSPKSIIIGGYGNLFTSLNLLTRNPSSSNAQQNINQFNSKNNYFSRKPSVQILDKNSVGDNGMDRMGNDMFDSSNFINSQKTDVNDDDLTDSKTSFNSLNVGNIDRLALAGDSSTKADSDLANAHWELTLLGAEEQCGPDRRRDSYGICQFVPADYATT